MQTPEISVVIPCYNEEDNVVLIYTAVRDELEKHSESYEIVFIDNNSTDSTRMKIREICAGSNKVWAIFNTRNFGQMRSPTHAIYQARGRAVIGMCADFQDPPALLGKFITAWREGAQIVLGVRKTERTGVMLGTIRRLGYGFLARNADYAVVPNATGFGLYDRRVVDTLKLWHEPEPFFRGMLIEAGFRCQLLPYDRPERLHGETKNGWRELLDFATSGLAGSSKGLLRRPILWSMGTAAIGVVMLIVAATTYVLGGDGSLGILLGTQVLLFSVLFLFIGLLGEQVRLISERTRNVSLVIEDERINFSPDQADGRPDA